MEKEGLFCLNTKNHLKN